MSQFKRPYSTLFKQLTYDNYYLKSQNNELRSVINVLEANISQLNRFIMSQYDLSFNVMENLRIVTFDGSGSVMSCIHSDGSGNFIPCTEMSGGYLPCVLPPMYENAMPENQEVMGEKVSKTHISDASRDFLYDYPYCGYRYPYFRNPYYGYPYYPYLYDNDYLYRGMDASCVNMQSMKPTQHPALIHGPNGTHIHIHTK